MACNPFAEGAYGKDGSSITGEDLQRLELNKVTINDISNVFLPRNTGTALTSL